MEFLKYYKPPFKYDPHGCSVMCADGKALDIRGWGMLTGCAAFDLSADESEKIQDDFGLWVADTLNKAIKESE